MYSTSLVRIRYVVGLPPFVEVIDPIPVREREGMATPHLNPDGSLCLFDPYKEEWDPSKHIADTIIPWASRWLLHYESWMSTGIWKGDAPMPATTNVDPLVVTPDMEIAT
jgi:hypothetical protein